MAKKTSVKVRKSRRAQPKTRNIRYRCDGTCKASPKFAHMSPGDVMVLIAVDVDARVTFIGGSPFKSKATQIRVAKGTAHPEVVANKEGVFEYRLSCSNPSCPSSVANPEMIVP